MKTLLTLACVAVGLAALSAAGPASAGRREPLRLHPQNPRYFELRGKPTVLVTSGEHYGAVLNADFDYLPYLDELRARGFNQTRTFAGPYREVPGSFNIQHNTLAPRGPEKYVSPWARSDVPGAADGGNKFDLTRWNDAFFRRLRDFVAQAGRRGVVVELVLFCTFYEDQLWEMSPMHARNNVNGIGNVPKDQVHALKEPALTAVQDAFVRKVAAELREFENLYYEVCNEPYFQGVTDAWQDHIAETLAAAEKGAAPHLIARNIANKTATVRNPLPHVSIYNFHYASPPDAVRDNWHLERPIGFDESGFRKTADLPYRTEAWEFLLAGGAVYSNLDYSYTPDDEAGTAPVVEPTPGGGGPSLRRQLQILKQFMDRLPFVRMAPADGVVRAGIPEKGSVRVLAEPGKTYAVYVRGGEETTLSLDLPAGRYRAEWIDTKTGATAKQESLSHPGGAAALASPSYQDDIALRISRR